MKQSTKQTLSFSLGVITVCSIIILMVSMFTSCSTVDPVARQSLIELLSTQLSSGRITQEQFDQLVTVIKSGASWSDILIEAGKIGVAIAGSLFGVKLWRGPSHKETGVE